MTAVAITSESATRPPTAVSGVMPVLWRSWSMNAMNAIGIATENQQRGTEDLALVLSGVPFPFGGGDRRLRAVGAELLGDDRARNTLTLLADAVCPLQRWLAEALRVKAKQRAGKHSDPP